MNKFGIGILALISPLTTSVLGFCSNRRKLLMVFLGLLPLIAGNYAINHYLGLSTIPKVLLSLPMILTFWIGLRLNVIGLTGGIATGKSSVSRALRSKGFYIVDAD